MLSQTYTVATATTSSTTVTAMDPYSCGYNLIFNGGWAQKLIHNEFLLTACIHCCTNLNKYCSYSCCLGSWGCSDRGNGSDSEQEDNKKVWHNWVGRYQIYVTTSDSMFYFPYCWLTALFCFKIEQWSTKVNQVLVSWFKSNVRKKV